MVNNWYDDAWQDGADVDKDDVRDGLRDWAIQHVTNVAGLQALTTRGHIGYWVRGAGLYLYDSSDTTTADDGGVLCIVSADSKRYKPAVTMFAAVISPAQITADQNNYAPTNFATAQAVRLTSDASRNITGLAGGASGRYVLLHNAGAQNIVLKDESASSTAANRFALNTDVTLGADQSIALWYDGTSSRWRVIGGAGSGGGGASALDDLTDVTITSVAEQQALKYVGGAWVNATAREVLTANRTYYVRTDGSDSNDGLANTSGGAFLTLQKAYNTAVSLDFSIYDVVIQVGAGTYTAGVDCSKPHVGKGSLTFRGDTTTPANVLISTTSDDCFYAENGAAINVEGFELRTTTSGNALNAFNLAYIGVTGLMKFGACAGQHIQVGRNSVVTSLSNYEISGGANTHWTCTGASTINANGSRTYTLTGTPAFTGNGFVNADRCGVVACHGVTFSGSATGNRYAASANGVVFTAGGGASFIPGNSAGTTATGGQYI